MKKRVGFSLRGGNRTVVYRGFAYGEGEKSGVLYAKDSRNCSLKDGQIARGVGALALADSFGAGTEIVHSFVKRLAVLPYRLSAQSYSSFTAYATMTGVYFYDYATGEYKLVYEGEDVKGFVPCLDGEGEYSFLLLDKTGARAADKKGALTELFTGTVVRAACFYGERAFFAAEPFTIRYSATFSPTELSVSVDEGGSAQLPSEGGEIHSLVRLGEYFYGFREREIVRISAKGSALEFEAVEIAVSGGRIFEGSVAACGEQIFYLAEEGLFAFDGKRARRILADMRISPRRGEQVCVQAVGGGAYFVQYADENNEWRSVVVERGGESGYYSFYKEGLSSSAGKALCLYNRRICELDERGNLPIEESAYFEAETDFGIRGEKALKSLTLKGKGRVAVTVTGERSSRRRIVELTNGTGKLAVGMKGEKYTLKFEPYAGARIVEVAASVYSFGNG